MIIWLLIKYQMEPTCFPDQHHHRDKMPVNRQPRRNVQQRRVPGGPGWPGRDVRLWDGQPAVRTEPRFRDLAWTLPTWIHTHVQEVSHTTPTHLRMFISFPLGMAAANHLLPSDPVCILTPTDFMSSLAASSNLLFFPEVCSALSQKGFERPLTEHKLLRQHHDRLG